MTEKVELIGLNKAELDRLMADIGEKPFRAKQLYQWLYVQGAVSFDEMTNLSKDLRAKLADKFTITRPKIVAEQLSRDKTHKWLLEFADGQRIETVYIPEADRGSCFNPGRLCRRLHFLSYRVAENYPQSDGRRNCQPVYGSARCLS